jgi:exopolysaccharide biosynthesis polyprenyl glycosylphosphotransferase
MIFSRKTWGRRQRNTATAGHPKFKERIVSIRNPVHGDRPEQVAAAANRFAAELHPLTRLRETLRQRMRLATWRIGIGAVYGLKRAIDLTGAALGTLLLAPVFILTALAIKLEDRGPVFYAQTRVGLHGRTFRMFKFRSMVVDAERLQRKLDAQNESAAGVLFKMRDDPRITRVGRLIRKLSIDELPQLLNVLGGSMSIVGPRPPLPREVEQYTQEERMRLEVKPGITCIWQVSGRSEIDFQGQVRLDLDYIRGRSFLGDIALILRTIPVVLLGKGAY